MKRVAKNRTPLPTLITKADKLTSMYIRQKFADENGICKCITCETVKHWTDMHCAHYIERAKKETRWHEENLHVACPSCNVYRKEYHKREYTLAILDMYGREGLDELKWLGNLVCSPSRVRALAEKAIADYSQALAELNT